MGAVSLNSDHGKQTQHFRTREDNIFQIFYGTQEEKIVKIFKWKWTVKICCLGIKREEIRMLLGWMLINCLVKKIILWRKEEEKMLWQKT